MDWRVSCEASPDGRATQLRLERGGAVVRWSDWLDVLEREPGVRAAFDAALAALPYDAFHWETPPLRADGLGAPFECVAIDGRALAQLPANPADFADVFRRPAVEGVHAFDNLGGDARLIAPAPDGDWEVHAHLGSFLRRAATTQIDALWRTVAREMRAAIGADPRWLSTAGLGVAWLHVRIDRAPKYYRWDPYRRDD